MNSRQLYGGQEEASTAPLKTMAPPVKVPQYKVMGEQSMDIAHLSLPARALWCDSLLQVASEVVPTAKDRYAFSKS